jgi:glycosyltransferase involved in cell wall biosynthesis
MPKLYLGLPFGQGVGWSVCSNYLRQELPKLVDIVSLKPEGADFNNQNLDAPFFVTLQDLSFNAFSGARGTKNYGYSFFEFEINDDTIKNAANYDTVFVGSTWCKDRLLEKGVTNVEVLIQGVNLDHYKPAPSTKPDALKDKFVIYSGGKFELRKGQDLVLKAVQIMQQRYPDVYLINNWFNAFPASVEHFKISPYIKYDWDIKDYPKWDELMMRFYIENGLDPSRIKTIPALLPESKLPAIYHSSDIGLFPNRCEGGTNLVLMEYMGCGKPVIASYISGHTDILTDENSLALKKVKPFEYAYEGTKIFRWQEPELEDILEKLEYAYHHRDEIKKIGEQGRLTMEKYPWSAMAQHLVNKIDFS